MPTFRVPVCRIAYAHRMLTIEADSAEQAQEKALIEPGNYEYSEKSAEYEVDFGGIVEVQDE